MHTVWQIHTHSMYTVHIVLCTFTTHTNTPPPSPQHTHTHTCMHLHTHTHTHTHTHIHTYTHMYTYTHTHTHTHRDTHTYTHTVLSNCVHGFLLQNGDSEHCAPHNFRGWELRCWVAWNGSVQWWTTVLSVDTISGTYTSWIWSNTQTLWNDVLCMFVCVCVCVITMIINLIYIAQFSTNSILSAVHIDFITCIKYMYTNAICAHDNNNNNSHIQRCHSRFFTISSLRREPSPTRMLKWPGHNRVQIMCNTFSAYAYHVQHVVISRATCRDTSHVVWRDSSAINLLSWQSWNRIILFDSIGWTIDQWRRGGNRSTRRKPLATSFRKCHILKPEDSSPKRDSNAHDSIGGRLGKQTC